MKDKIVPEFGLTDILSGALGGNLVDQNASAMISLIIPGKYQPRSDFNKTDLEELALSIKEQGVLQPILVRVVPGSDKLELIAGERRFRAAKMCGLQEIPIVCLEVDENQAHVAALVENIQREDLNPIEEAKSYQNIINRLGLTHEEFSRKIGIKRSVISNMLRLLSLNTKVQKLIESQALSVGHAKLLVALESLKQVELAEIVISKGLTVRRLEVLIKNLLTSKNTYTKEFIPESSCSFVITTLEERFGLKFEIGLTRGEKNIISFGNIKEFEKFMELLT